MWHSSSRRTVSSLGEEKIPLHRYLHRDRESALAALESVGGVLQRRLDGAVMHEQIGAVRRYFALFGNVFSESCTAPVEILEPIQSILRERDNEEIRERLERGELQYTPMNKRMIRSLAGAFQSSRVHIPWTFTPMNYDLAARIEKVHRHFPYPFTTFYSRTAIFYPSKRSLHDGLVEPGRLFSLVVQGQLQGTWHQPIHDGMLDPDVALLIEANTA